MAYCIGMVAGAVKGKRHCPFVKHLRIDRSAPGLLYDGSVTGLWSPDRPSSSRTAQLFIMAKLAAKRSGPLKGRAAVPGDKSISHRALMFGALSIGETRVTGLLEAGDVLATARAVEMLGAQVLREDGEWIVSGRGIGGLISPQTPLDFGNSGTGARLMMGIVAGHPVEVRFTGDASLCRRPMGRVLKPLRAMGLTVAEGDKDTLPLTLIGSGELAPIRYVLPVPSAQVKSAVLLAGLSTPGDTTVVEAEATRDHTEKMLTYLGAQITVDAAPEGRAITLKGQPLLKGRPIRVPADPSSSAFLAAAALICPGSEIVIENVLVNPTRTGFYTTLAEMGADIAFEGRRDQGGEPVADIRVKHSTLRGVTVPPERAPTMIDEYPMLAALSAYAEGTTFMQGLAELRVKESDRLSATLAGLLANGINAEAGKDTLTVRGTGRVAGGGLVETDMDHRIAMAFLTLGLGAEKPVTVDDVTMIDTSFPNFASLMTGLGAEFEGEEEA
jgi:3-phosphoshikimate 1-carboxyvinyltransferase